MPLAIPQRAAGGGVSSGATLPMASEPAAPNRSPISKPTIAPTGTPAAPTLPVAPVTAPAPAPSPAPPTASQGGERTAPVSISQTPNASPSAPSPFQTNDPLAFSPTAGTTNVSGSQVTESAGSFLPPDLHSPPADGLNVPAPTLAPIPTSGGAPSYGLTPTTPEGSLINSTITPGAGVDRYAIANDLLANWDANEQPQFDRRIQDLSQNAAGRGQIGSGMVRGSFRDALNDEQTRRTNAQRGFLTDALGGSIDDAYKNVGIAQQQQGFQAGQAQQGFNNNVTLQQLTDSEQGQYFQQLMASMGFNSQQMQAAFDNAFKTQQLSDDETGQAFYRAMQQYILGSQGDPAELDQWLAQLYALPTPK